MMSYVIIAEQQLIVRVHILINIQQTFHSGFDVHKLPQMQNGRIYKVDLTADKPPRGCSVYRRLYSDDCTTGHASTRSWSR
jgi:hypothetical protein